jgi:anti-sigma factor RsiW
MVKDLGDRGFPLIGGRLDYLDAHPVAALLYKRNQHPINLFEWPSSVVSEAQTTTIRGYNLIYWSKSGMTFWAVSDLNARELGEFAREIQVN